MSAGAGTLSPGGAGAYWLWWISAAVFQAGPVLLPLLLGLVLGLVLLIPAGVLIRTSPERPTRG